MCCIVQPATVFDTNIAVVWGTDRQQTVYANRMQTHQPNTMVVAVPFPESVVFHDLSNQPNLFPLLQGDFYDVRPHRRSGFGSEARYSTNATITHYQVGAYQVSLIPSADQLDQLLSPELGSFLRAQQRATPFPLGYIRFTFTPGHQAFHPFAYSHQALPTLPYIPTLHWHGRSSPIEHYQHQISLYGIDPHTIRFLRTLFTIPEETTRPMKHSATQDVWLDVFCGKVGRTLPGLPSIPWRHDGATRLNLVGDHVNVDVGGQQSVGGQPSGQPSGPDRKPWLQQLIEMDPLVAFSYRQNRIAPFHR